MLLNFKSPNPYYIYMAQEMIVKKQKEILELLAPFCVQKLSDEYFMLASKLLKMLAESFLCIIEF